MTNQIKTLGEAIDYTLKTRHSWRHGNGRRTALINIGHVTEHLGRSFPVGRITQACVSQMCIDLEESGRSSSTINRIISALSTVLNHCAFDGLIDHAPRFRKLKEGEHRLTWFTKDEVENLYYGALDPFDRQDLADVTVFAAYTGLRMGEILKLRAQDIDLSTEKIHVGGRPEVVTKANNYRCIPIAERIKPMLHHQMEHVGPNVKIFGDSWTNKDQLFRAFVKVRNYVGKSEEYVFHSLRHSYATWLAEAGCPMRTLMTLLGHKRIETTLRYAKTTDKALVDAVALL